MIIKLHITGYATAYEPRKISPKKSDKPGRYQGSLYSQQKHAIADAIEWMRLNAVYKPRIFVATTPGFIDPARETNHIKSLTHNLRNGYGMLNYVWVRELTGNGFPHWHFVADLPQFDAVKLSLYWSGLFDSDSKCSIRLGTRPDKRGFRRYWITSKRMSWYLGKYIGKDLHNQTREPGERRPYQTFRISKEAARESKPVTYQSNITSLYNGRHWRSFDVTDDHLERTENGIPVSIDPTKFNWKWTGRGQTYSGFKKD